MLVSPYSKFTLCTVHRTDSTDLHVLALIVQYLCTLLYCTYALVTMYGAL